MTPNPKPLDAAFSSNVRVTKHALTARRASFACLLAALLWAPWPLGSNRAWAVAILGAILGLALILASMASLLAATPSRIKAAPFSWLPLAALAGFALILVVQLIPGFGPQGGVISLDPFQTKHYLFTTCVYLVAWAVVLMTADSDKRVNALLGSLVAVGVAQASVAVLLNSTNWRYQFLFTDFEQGGRAMGTFVNPDHLAGYMELTLSAGLGWLLSQFSFRDETKVREGWQGSVSSLLLFLLSPKMLLRLMLVIAVVALVMTHSRMGNGAFFLALFALGAVVAWRSKQLRRPAIWVVVSMALVDVVVIGQWVGLDRVVARIRDTTEVSISAAAPVDLAAEASTSPYKPISEQSIQERLQVPLLSIPLVAARPWLGHGGGTYALAFPPFKQGNQDGAALYWDHAHNDYVQVAADTGLLGLALWLTVGIATAWRAFSLLSDQHTSLQRGCAVAVLMALFCMGLHSMVDFNLHIPANALSFTILLACVWAVPASKGTRRSRSSKDTA